MDQARQSRATAIAAVAGVAGQDQVVASTLRLAQAPAAHRCRLRQPQPGEVAQQGCCLGQAHRHCCREAVVLAEEEEANATTRLLVPQALHWAS